MLRVLWFCAYLGFAFIPLVSALAEVSIVGADESEPFLVGEFQREAMADGGDQLQYPHLLAYYYAEAKPQSLWFSEHEPRAHYLRQQLQFLVLERYLATNSPLFKQWWALLQQEEIAPSQLELIYSDAFLGLLASEQYLQSLDYQQAMSLQHLQWQQAPSVDRLFIQQLTPERIAEFLALWQTAQSFPAEIYQQWLLYWYELASSSHWPTLRYQGLIRPDQHSVQLPFVRRQLWLINPDWHLAAEDEARYDPPLELLIRRFQRQHGLVEDGIIGHKTLYWLNFSPLKRAQRLARNAVRQRLFSAHLNQGELNHFVVNLPAYQLTFYQNGQPFLQSRVVIGRRSRKTPLLVGDISQVVLNPYWNVPRSILRKDLLSKFIEQPEYIQQHGYQLIDYQERIVDPMQLDWQQIAQSRQFPFRVRQQPGQGNALGRYKFHFANDYAVYLHDTSAPELFEAVARPFSSGCVRVEQAELLAQQLLDNAGISRERQQHWLGSEKPKWVGLPQTVPVYLVYFSAWFDRDNTLQFRNDIYQYDDIDMAEIVIESATVAALE